MSTYSSFQERFPLSKRRKFWKKMLEKALLLLFIGGFLSTPLLPIFVFTSQERISPLITGPAVVLFCVFTVFALYALYVRAYINRYYYDSDVNFITIKKGVILPAEIHVQHRKIQDVYVDQDLLDRVLSIYDVHIASATTGSAFQAHIDGVSHETVQALKNELLKTIVNADTTPGEPAQPVAQPAATTATPAISASVASEMQSRLTFPIDRKWLWGQFIAAIPAAAALVFAGEMFVFGYTGRRSETTIAEMFGWDVSMDTRLIIGLVLFIVAYVGTIIWAILWRNTFSYTFSSHFLTIKSGVIFRQERNLPYKAIQDVTIRESLVDRIFGLATVEIENAAQSIASSRHRQDKIRVPGLTRAHAQALTEGIRGIMIGAKPETTGL